MATKVNGKAKDAEKSFVKMAKARAGKAQAARRDFVQKFGKALSAGWSKLGDKANVMSVAKAVAPKEPVRLVHYALVSLGLVQTKDGALIAWRDADKTATSEPKAKKNGTKA